MMACDVGMRSSSVLIQTRKGRAHRCARPLSSYSKQAQWCLCFLLFLPLPFFLPLPLPDLPPPIAALQAELILALFLKRQDTTLARSGMNSLQMLCASLAQGCPPPPCPDFMSSARCAPAGAAHKATQNAAATSFHLLMRILPSFRTYRSLGGVPL